MTIQAPIKSTIQIIEWFIMNWGLCKDTPCHVHAVNDRISDF